MTVRIKICGITREQDAHAAVAAGASALGFIFHAGSPRYIGTERAQAIVSSIPPFITSVGVFVNMEIDALREIVCRVGLDLVQLHGEESPQYARRLALPYVRAVRVRADGIDLRQEAEKYVQARAILLDAYVAGVPGGTGTQFSWIKAPLDMSKPTILAGGLDASNVGAAIEQTKPYAVDVSSGVETEPGIKDHNKIKAFVAAVRDAE